MVVAVSLLKDNAWKHTQCSEEPDVLIPAQLDEKAVLVQIRKKRDNEFSVSVSGIFEGRVSSKQLEHALETNILKVEGREVVFSKGRGAQKSIRRILNAKMA